MKKNQKRAFKGALVAAALATMLVPGAALAGKAAKAATVKCDGSNDCKGKGSCKSANNDCKGQNDCKGKSFTTEKSAKACTKKHGTVAAAEAAPPADAK